MESLKFRYDEKLNLAFKFNFQLYCFIDIDYPSIHQTCSPKNHKNLAPSRFSRKRFQFPEYSYCKNFIFFYLEGLHHFAVFGRHTEANEQMFRGVIQSLLIFFFIIIIGICVLWSRRFWIWRFLWFIRIIEMVFITNLKHL